jgi:hypothetical protein
MSADHDYSGDYGYDLMHEARSFVQIPSQRARVLTVRGGRAAGYQFDPDSDLGYDQAHEL